MLTNHFFYLIYGYAMITMGIFAIKQKGPRLVNLSLVKSLKYLGYFGIIHGISEWITMMINVESLGDLDLYLYNMNMVIKAVSFAFLLNFGLDLLPVKDKIKRKINKIPVILLSLYIVGFLFLLVNYGLDYHFNNAQYNIITLKYLMGFAGSMITAVALYLNAKFIEKTKRVEISRRYISLACIFIIYGCLEGLIVPQQSFFPANILNRELFTEYLRFSPLYIKAFIGFVVYNQLIKVIDTFNWEQEERLNLLEKQRIACEERGKLGLEIHDTIIQELYAAGLKVEYLSMNKNEEKCQDILNEVKCDLNRTISRIREFISSSALDKIELEDLTYSLQELVDKYNKSQGIKINILCDISPYNQGYLSQEKSTQIYYIVQEAILNVIKHSEAEYANVYIEGRYDFLYITVIDNGKGISLDNKDSKKHFGINSMKDRAQAIGAVLRIENVKKGTRIVIRIPWEELKYEAAN